MDGKAPGDLLLRHEIELIPVKGVRTRRRGRGEGKEQRERRVRLEDQGDKGSASAWLASIAVACRGGKLAESTGCFGGCVKAK